MESKKKPFYGWVNIAVLFFVAAVPMAIYNNFWAYYQVPVTTDLGVSFIAFSFTSVVSTIAGMLFSALLAGKMTQGNTRRFMFIGALAAAAGFYAQSYITQMWQLYVMYFLVSFAMNSITFIAINFIISQWFIDKKGLITGIVLAGSGLGGVFLSGPLAGIIANPEQGWRFGWRATAIVLVVTAVVILLFIRKSPAEMGTEPYTQPKKAGEEGADGAAAANATAWLGLTKGEAVKTSAFWLFAAMMLLAGMTAAGIMTQVPSFFIENELDYAKLISVFSLATIFGSLILGPVIDKCGLKVGGILAAAIAAVAVALLTFVPRTGSTMAYICMVIFPLGAPVATILPPLLTGKAFGYKDFGGIYGLGNVFFMGGCMIGPVFATTIHDNAGSYIPAWWAFAAIFLLIPVFAILAVNAAKKYQK